MADLIKCKACGYITRAGSVGDVCPACGVPARMFEPYTDPVSEKRRRILDLHIHPVMVHFPQASAFSLPVLALAAFASPPAVKSALLDAIKVISLFLPFLVVIAFAAGIEDGILRFRKVTTPFLKLKMMIGISFLALSIGMAVLAFLPRFPASPTLELFTILAALSAVCGMALGFFGGKLLAARFPG